MQTKKLLFSVIFLSFFSYTAYAEVPKPNKCPSVAAIKTRGLDFVDEYCGFVGVISDKYDTDTNFTFGIEDVSGKNSTEKMKLAKKALTALTFISGPDRPFFSGPDPNFDKHGWICIYRAGDYVAAAWTPPHA